jgi:hypothetical protein
MSMSLRVGPGEGSGVAVAIGGAASGDVEGATAVDGPHPSPATTGSSTALVRTVRTA